MTELDKAHSKLAKETAKRIMRKLHQAGAKPISTCKPDFIDADNEGVYGQEECRFCGEKRSKP